MGEGRFLSFTVSYKDSDLWIGVDVQSFKLEMVDFAQNRLVELRKELELYILKNPEFASSYSPLKLNSEMPAIAREMTAAALKAGTGPMAAVAGSFSEFIGAAIQAEFDINEIVVENGGDIYLSLKRDMVLSVYAGDSPLSGKIGIEIPAAKTPLGVCTSAGTVGPSISFGKADAVVVVSPNTAVADAFATAIGNRVKTAANVASQLTLVDVVANKIDSILIICEGQLGVKGDYELRMIGKEE